MIVIIFRLYTIITVNSIKKIIGHNYDGLIVLLIFKIFVCFEIKLMNIYSLKVIEKCIQRLSKNPFFGAGDYDLFLLHFF